MVVLTSNGKQALDSLVAKVVEEQNIPGFVFGASTADEEIYFKGGGYNVVDDPSSGFVNEDSVFWICSQTKLITHLAALHLIEQGKLTLESIVSDYLPEFANPVILDDVMADAPSFKPAKTIIRVKHLLNFSSGLFYPMKGEDAYVQPHEGDPSSAFFSFIKGDLPGIPLKFEPGTDFAYGWSADALGFIIEKASGSTLEEYLHKNIFEPLGMKSSFFLIPELKEKLVDLAFRRDGKLEHWAGQTKINERDPSKVNRLFGGVGLYSSLKDYLTLLRHLLQIHAGKAAHPILSRETILSLFEPALPEAGSQSIAHFVNSMDPFTPETGYHWSSLGLALNSMDWPGARKKGSGFWSGWANTYSFIDPTTGVAAVFGTQVFPPCDHEVMRLNAEFEKVLYKGLE